MSWRNNDFACVTRCCAGASYNCVKNYILQPDWSNPVWVDVRVNSFPEKGPVEASKFMLMLIPSINIHTGLNSILENTTNWETSRVSLKSGDKSSFNYAIYRTDFGQKSKVLHSILQKSSNFAKNTWRCMILHREIIILHRNSVLIYDICSFLRLKSRRGLIRSQEQIMPYSEILHRSTYTTAPSNNFGLVRIVGRFSDVAFQFVGLFRNLKIR